MAKRQEAQNKSENLWLRWALGAFVISLILKLAYFLWFAGSESVDMFVRFGYLLVLLIAIFFSVTELRHDETPTTTLVKTGMKSAAVYAILLAAFTFFYYKVIDSSYFELKAQKVIDAAMLSERADPEKVKQNAEMIFNPFTHGTLTLFGTMIIGTAYSLIISLMHKRLNLRLA